MKFTQNMVVLASVLEKLFGIIVVMIRQCYTMLKDKKYRGRATRSLQGCYSLTLYFPFPWRVNKCQLPSQAYLL